MTIEIRCESSKDAGSGAQLPLFLPASKDSSSQIGDLNRVEDQAHALHSDGVAKRRGEIVEEVSPRRCENNEQQVDVHVASHKSLEGANIGQGSTSHKKPIMAAHPERRRLREQGQSKSIVKSKVSLAHVIQQAEGRTQRVSWSKRKAVSIAEKLEQENLYVSTCHSFLVYPVLTQHSFILRLVNSDLRIIRGLKVSN